jgi:hypothetical protein
LGGGADGVKDLLSLFHIISISLPGDEGDEEGEVR